MLVRAKWVSGEGEIEESGKKSVSRGVEGKRQKKGNRGKYGIV